MFLCNYTALLNTIPAGIKNSRSKIILSSKRKFLGIFHGAMREKNCQKLIFQRYCSTV
jgi:hypothetical protein